LISLYSSAFIDFLADIYSDYIVHTDQYVKDGKNISVRVNGEVTNIDILLENLINGGISHVLRIYYSTSIDYLNYMNNYLLGVKLTHASMDELTSGLSMPANSTFEKIRNSMHTIFIHVTQQQANAYSLITPVNALSFDTTDVFDFPHDFDSLVASLKNKLILAESFPISTKYLIDMIYEYTNDGNNTDRFKNISRFLRTSKSSFGIDSIEKSTNDATYSHNLVSLTHELSVVSRPNIAKIKQLVTKINTTKDTSELDYITVLQSNNTKIAILNASLESSDAIPLLIIPGHTSSAPTDNPKKKGIPVLLIFFILIMALFIISYFMSKKNIK